jgi:hypothetical protein
MKPKKIYISGPMRGYENLNFDAFDEMEQHLKAEGWTVINPVAMDRLMNGWDKYPPEDWQWTQEDVYDCMRRDLCFVFECDAIYMLKGWKDSDGANAEYALAKCLGLELIYQVV